MCVCVCVHACAYECVCDTKTDLLQLSEVESAHNGFSLGTEVLCSKVDYT